MLRHLKMELKRQQQAQNQMSPNDNNQIDAQHQEQAKLDWTRKASEQSNQAKQQQKRVRGRRSSKPMMEKRRRARINQCLDILKSYVLTDSNNLNQLGIDTSARENQDEETIARTILKSSGLINRHRGRKNPNKLEKADILELTVDYVRRLHEQRDELLMTKKQLSPTTTVNTNKLSQQQMLPLTNPLTLNITSIESKNHIALQATPPSPPPSSASSSPQPLLSISSNIQHYSPTISSSNDVLDLSGSKRTRANIQQQVALLPAHLKPFYKDGVLYVESQDGCWRPWNLVVQN